MFCSRLKDNGGLYNLARDTRTELLKQKETPFCPCICAYHQNEIIESLRKSLRAQVRERKEIASSLAGSLYQSILPLFQQEAPSQQIDFIIPMPASTARPSQPVELIAQELSLKSGIPVIQNLLLKSLYRPAENINRPAKNINREEKEDLLRNSFSLNPEFRRDSLSNVNILLLDDVYDTGATMNVACETLKRCNNIKNIYVATLTYTQKW